MIDFRKRAFALYDLQRFDLEEAIRKLAADVLEEAAKEIELPMAPTAIMCLDTCEDNAAMLRTRAAEILGKKTC